MDVPKLLETSSLPVPEKIATENDITVSDVWEYLAHDEWELALDLLEELGDVRPLPVSFWITLGRAAERMRLERSAAWCYWRGFETKGCPVTDDPVLRGRPRARMQVWVHLPPDLIHGHLTMQTTTGATSMANSHRPTLAGE
ncbi:hypothetical protein [Streptomyces hundungensis]|uniref:hypothetical protein n=1 Tax=Streptomyces hundungensis TaxID=1077946 RepID=UPI003F541DDD